MSPSSLVVLPVNRVLNNNQPQANIMDNKPMVNILPFGLCRSLANPVVASATSAAMGTLTPMPCIPNTPAPWMPGNPKALVSNKPALHKPSKLMCAYAGTISIVNPGQMTVKDGAMFAFHSIGKKHAVNAKVDTMQADAHAESFVEKDGRKMKAGFDTGASFTALEANGDMSLGDKNNPLVTGEGEVKVLTAEARASGATYTYAGIRTGTEFDAAAQAAVAKGSATLGFGGDKNNPLVAVTGDFEAVSAKAWAEGFAGNTDDKVGFAFDAGADAKMLGGGLEGVRNIPIPFTNWTIQTKAKVSGKLGGVGADIGGKAYYDKKVKRAYLGASGGLSALLGVDADIEISIGKKYEQQ